MKLRLALILGGLAMAGVIVGLLMLPSPEPPAARTTEPAKWKPVMKAAAPGPEVVQDSVSTAAAPATSASRGPAPNQIPSVKPIAPGSDAPAPGVPAATQADYLADLDNVRLMLRDYRTLMGQNPVGSNAEIMKAVMGGNPKHANLGPPQGQSVNGNGELVDRWGTPYFFHQQSATNMEIRSAGPDRIMWTSDDIVMH
jgi:hypothetical protein